MDHGYIDEDPEVKLPDEEVIFADEDDANSGDNAPISEEDAWTVISSHFHERGLVGQQLDSFDVFMTNTMQVRIFLILFVCSESTASRSLKMQFRAARIFWYFYNAPTNADVTLVFS